MPMPPCPISFSILYVPATVSPTSNAAGADALRITGYRTTAAGLLLAGRGQWRKARSQIIDEQLRQRLQVSDHVQAALAGVGDHCEERSIGAIDADRRDRDVVVAHVADDLS